MYFFLSSLEFGIYRSGSLNVPDPLSLRNMSSCEFDVVAMDDLYATRVHLKLICKSMFYKRILIIFLHSSHFFSHFACTYDNLLL